MKLWLYFVFGFLVGMLRPCEMRKRFEAGVRAVRDAIHNRSRFEASVVAERGRCAPIGAAACVPARPRLNEALLVLFRFAFWPACCASVK